MVGVDEIVVGIGEERWPVMCGRPLAGRVGMGRELWHHISCSTERFVIQRQKVFYDSAGRRLGIDGVEVPVLLGGGILLVGVGRNQARVGRKPITAHDAPRDALCHDRLKDMSKEVTLPEPAVAVL